MWHMTCPMHHEIGVAVSGGADSMALLHYASRHPDRKVYACMFDHGTGFHQECLPLVQDFCQKNNIMFMESGIDEQQKPDRESKESWWRQARYSWLETLPFPVFTGHHLDDVAENWISTCINGTPSMIPVQRNNVFRPLLAVRKQEILEYCQRHNVPYIDDPANFDSSYMKTILRQEVIPAALKVNRGLHNMLKRKVLKNKLTKKTASYDLCFQKDGNFDDR